MFASSSDPLFKDLYIDSLSIFPMFMSYGTDSVILQQEETKLVVLDTNLLRNVDPSPSAFKCDTVNQGWSFSLIT